MERPISKEEYLDEIIDERSLTLEDGRKRGVTIQLVEDDKTLPEPSGRDDGDSLG